MFDELKKPDIERCSGSELRALIRRALPTVIAFVQASQKLLSEDELNQSPCRNCDKRSTCGGICESLETLLPGKYEGSDILNRNLGDLLDKISDSETAQNVHDDENPKRLDHSSLKTIDRIRTDEMFMLYKNCHPIFTKREWQVITLRVEEGLTYKVIGAKLGITIATASDTFRRAKKKMENHYKGN